MGDSYDDRIDDPVYDDELDGEVPPDARYEREAGKELDGKTPEDARMEREYEKGLDGDRNARLESIEERVEDLKERLNDGNRRYTSVHVTRELFKPAEAQSALAGAARREFGVFENRGLFGLNLSPSQRAYETLAEARYGSMDERREAFENAKAEIVATCHEWMDALKEHWSGRRDEYNASVGGRNEDDYDYHSGFYDEDFDYDRFAERFRDQEEM